MAIYHEPSVLVPIATLFHRAALIPGFDIVGFTGMRAVSCPSFRGILPAILMARRRAQATRQLAALGFAPCRRPSTGLPAPALDVAERLRRQFPERQSVIPGEVPGVEKAALEGHVDDRRHLG